MFKLITYAYIATISTAYASVGMWEPVTDGEICEIANLQSPFIRKLDNPSVDADKFIPVHACIVDISMRQDRQQALLQCIKPQKPVKL